jgi:hypothetical protein
MRGFFAALLLLVMVTATPAQAQRTEAEVIYCNTLPGGLFATAEIYPPEFSDSAHPLFYRDLRWAALVHLFDSNGTYRGRVSTGWYNKPAVNDRWSPLSFHSLPVWPLGGVATHVYLFDATDGRWLYHARPGPASPCQVR